MFSYMNLFKTVLIFFSVIAAVSCGTAGGDVEVSELDASELCRLQQADNPIRELYSMAVQNDSTVLLSTDREVLRYSFEGRRLKNLGNKGRAAGEYNMPMKVRVDGDRIFVWDAMNLGSCSMMHLAVSSENPAIRQRLRTSFLMGIRLSSILLVQGNRTSLIFMILPKVRS